MSLRGACCALVAAGCAHRSLPVRGNVTDELARAAGVAETQADPGSPVSAYRRLIAPVLGSTCRWLPSDSEYLVRSARRCGGVSSLYATFAGVLEEPDVDRVGLRYVVDHDRVRWVRRGLPCEP